MTDQKRSEQLAPPAPDPGEKEDTFSEVESERTGKARRVKLLHEPCPWCGKVARDCECPLGGSTNFMFCFEGEADGWGPRRAASSEGLELRVDVKISTRGQLVNLLYHIDFMHTLIAEELKRRDASDPFEVPA